MKELMSHSNMKTIEDHCKELLAIVAGSPSKSGLHSFGQLFQEATEVNAIMAYLLSEEVVREQKYRLLVVALLEEGKPKSTAEAIAKASEEYVAYRKLQNTMKLADDHVKLIKKFSDKLKDDQFRSSTFS